ncbi:MAG: hypothetical protein KC620_19180 [Myxococcales bacterium]|nr:hypothetical protein [Myxococcales bacterium]
MRIALVCDEPLDPDGPLAQAFHRLDHVIYPVDAALAPNMFVQRLAALGADLVLIAAKGPRGAEGTAFVAQVCEALDLPYAGSRPTACAVAANADVARALVARAGVPVADDEARATRAVDVLEGATLGEVPDALAERAEAAFAALGLRDLARLHFTADNRFAHAEPTPLPAGPSATEAALTCLLDEARERTEPGDEAPFATDRPLVVGLIYNLKRRQPGADGSNDAEAEFDTPKTIDALAAALAAGGHQVVPLEADATLFGRLRQAGIDVAFNIAEGLRGRGRESLVPALLEMLDIPYTGSDPAALAVTLDKALAKRLVRQAGIATADFAVMVDPDAPLPEWLTWPAIVKPVAEGSSKGVVGTSVVRSEEALRKQVRLVVERYNQAALVEAFLPGREFTVGLVGGPVPHVLPPMEIGFPEGEVDPVYGFEKKFGGAEVRLDVPARVTPELDAALRATALAAFESLGCRDVGRVDLRLDEQGRVNFIECNPLPGMAPGFSDLVVCAAADGLDYAALVARILAPALARWRGSATEGGR